MTTELTPADQPSGETSPELVAQQTVVEAALDLAVVAIGATQDHEQRAALVDSMGAKLGAVGIVLHDREDHNPKERVGRSGLTRDQVLDILATRPRRKSRSRSRLGWQTD